jgi:pimeloyl-ACP methyl ester carboxylesterase
MPSAREAGNGPGVVCLHCNASSSSQWRDLMMSLAPRFRVLAPDLYGSGKSADWPSDRTISLQDEVAFIEPVLPTGDSFSIVGHSHGAAVGLMLALAYPQCVRALVLHELRSLLGEETFWIGLKSYTQRYWGQSVETADFVRAMQEASHQDLSVFFEKWVFAKQSVH